MMADEMKNFLIQIVQFGHVGFVESFAANGETFAFVVTANKADALLTSYEQAAAISAFLGSYGKETQHRHV